MMVLKIVGLLVVVVVAALLVYAATRTDRFRIERSASIKAPPEKIFSFMKGTT